MSINSINTLHSTQNLYSISKAQTQIVANNDCKPLPVDTFTKNPTNPPIKTALYNSIKMLLKDYPFQGIALSLSHGGRTYEATGGTIGVNNAKPVTAETVFGIGSVTKTFTAAAILKLVQTGDIQLDTPITQYLPSELLVKFPTASQITVRDLLHQTSGLPEFNNQPDFLVDEIFLKKPKTPLAKTLNLLNFASKGKMEAPHEHWQYCNTNYLLLGQILESVTKQPLKVVYDTLLFKPLGLNNTFLDPSTITNKQIIASSGWEDGFDPIAANAGGAGALYSNNKDLQTFFKALFKDKTVLKPEMLAEMITIQPTDGSDGYGLGIINKGTAEAPILCHNGQTLNYGSFVIYNPQTDVLLTGLASNKLTKADIIKTALTKKSTTPGNIPTLDSVLETTPIFPELIELLKQDGTIPP